MSKDYMISVPVVNANFKRQGREEIVAQLKKLGAKRVFLARDCYTKDAGKFKEELEALKENCDYLHQKGYEVGIWGWSFIFDTPENEFTLLTSFNGVVNPVSACPLDKNFLEFAGKYIIELAKVGPDMILFDDDFRIAYSNGLSCACKNHLARISEIVGESVTAEQMKEKLNYGGKNKYRDAYIKVNGEAMEGFARHMRECVDTVDPSIRIGQCACMSSWDIDGSDGTTTSRLFAGNTKPYLRLIGATYWPMRQGALGDCRLANVIELMRMEMSWCEDDMEVVAEGDVWPRPRHTTPSSFLELYDMAMRADGRLSGIMKYGIDYFSKPSYETGYIEAHCRNSKIYEQIEDKFSNKTACGVRVYEKMKKYADMQIPECIEGTDKAKDIFYSKSSRMLADNSIPTVYEGEGVCGIAFGENVKMVPEDAMKHGLIIDAEAARLLQEKGIDTGIIELGKCVTTAQEYFVEQDDYTHTGYPGYRAHITKLKENAQILSYFTYRDESCAEQKSPASYYYQNDKGYRFLVFTFDGHFNNQTIYRSYMRSAQLKKAIEYLSGEKLPAYSYGNPDLYIMAKKDEQGDMAVGLWNTFYDEIYEPVVTLDMEYSDIEFINCTGRIEGNKVYLSPISALTFAGFEVKK